MSRLLSNATFLSRWPTAGATELNSLSGMSSLVYQNCDTEYAPGTCMTMTGMEFLTRMTLSALL